ncbi:MAG: hypothetical protein KZQ86_05580 [Candidatus Thiodiazotropha sp. (ex Lucinoma kastoroae)]|nr:hypothetical protein [Candidatus Thiodiazotropha sp. (ex Lucinoma kastoroae)]
MNINIGNYNFYGPFASASGLQNQSGVYAILGRNGDSEQWKVVDIGESARVQERVANHDRASCWNRKGHSRIAAAAYYCAEPQRMNVERVLRSQFDPPCGDR